MNPGSIIEERSRKEKKNIIIKAPFRKKYINAPFWRNISSVTYLFLDIPARSTAGIVVRWQLVSALSFHLGNPHWLKLSFPALQSPAVGHEWQQPNQHRAKAPSAVAIYVPNGLPVHRSVPLLEPRALLVTDDLDS